MIRPSKNLRLLKSKAEHPLAEVDWKACLPKTWVTPEGQTLPGRTVLEHCQIVGRIAEALIVIIWPSGMAGQLFPYNLPLLAALHDVGKVTPIFQKKLALALTGNRLGERDRILEASYGWHAGASRLAMLSEHIPEVFAWVAGAHHGNMERSLQTFQDNEALGGSQWDMARHEVLSSLQESFPATATATPS